MTTIFNIRGTNGSGKTTLARSFLGPYPVDLSEYEAPTKKDPGRKKRYPATVNDDDVMLLGSYANTCGGMDGHPAGKGFAVPLAALWWALGYDIENDAEMARPIPKAIICEGVLASGVYGSWHEFAKSLRTTTKDHDFAFVYLHTPAEVCLERIRDRQRAAGKVPALPGTPDYDRMVFNVTDKWKGTMATREKAIRDGHVVYDLPPGTKEDQVWAMQHLVAGDSMMRTEFRARA